MTWWKVGGFLTKKTFQLLPDETVYTEIDSIENVKLTSVLDEITTTSITLEFSFPGLNTFQQALTNVVLQAYTSSNASSYDIDTNPIVYLVDDTVRNTPNTFNLLVEGFASWTEESSPVWQHIHIRLQFGPNRYLVLPMFVTQTRVTTLPAIPTIHLVSSTHNSLTFAVELGDYNDVEPSDAIFAYRVSSESFVDLQVIDETTTQITISGLTHSTSYDVRINKYYSIDGVVTPLFVNLDANLTGDGIIYRWDFGALTDYDAETITGDRELAFVEGSGNPFRGQFVDDFGRKGIIAGNNVENVFNGIQYTGNSGLQVIGNQSIKDSFDMSDMSIVVNFSIRDDYYLSGSQRADIRFGLSMLYDTTFSSNLNDPNQQGGFSFSFYAKSTKTMFRAYCLETDPATGEFLNPQTSSIDAINDLTYTNTYKQHPGTDGVRFIPIRDGQYLFDATGGDKQVTYVSKVDSSTGRHTFKLYFCQTLMLTRTLNQNSTEFQLYKNTFKNLINISEIGETHGNSLMNIYDVTVYGREIQVDEMASYVPHFDFKYHFINEDYGIVGTGVVSYTGQTENYIEMQGDVIYMSTVYYMMVFDDLHWREYELEYHSGTVGVEFFNVTSTSVYASGQNYFDVTNPGIAFGVIDGALTYRVGSSVVDAGVTVSAGDRKFISVYMGSDTLKFYYDKTLVGEVLNSNESTFWTDVIGGSFCHSWFNIGTSTANRLYHLVKHTDSDLDLGVSPNTLL